MPTSDPIYSIVTSFHLEIYTFAYFKLTCLPVVFLWGTICVNGKNVFVLINILGPIKGSICMLYLNSHYQYSLRPGNTWVSMGVHDRQWFVLETS